MNVEQAVINFYEWEIKGRGYLLYPNPVNLEPTFKYFHHSNEPNSEYVDDGLVPNLWSRLFSKKKTIIEESIVEDESPFIPERNIFFDQIKISFPINFDFNKSETLEFLNMLSESQGQISFEIIGTNKKIEIQIVCNSEDSQRILHLLSAYFPEVILNKSFLKNLPFEFNHNIALVDFGYNEEFMRPINLEGSLIGIMAVMEHLNVGEVAVLQIIFQGVKKPWANSILSSVQLGRESFFPESPEMLTCAKEKVSNPLFAVVIRLAVQVSEGRDSKNLADELILNIKSATRSEFNSLIPLTNEDYRYSAHLNNLKMRESNRFGMIMNSRELSSLVYFPHSAKLISSDNKTKSVPQSLLNHDYLLGINNHLGVEKRVTLNDNHRLRHCHIIGATGTGKSTLISNLFIEDVKKGNGCVIFDPHGDTINEIIDHIPDNRLEDVILIDPSDYEYSFGINLLSANTEIEKIVLSSDLVGAFKRHSTSWGDQMTSVLSNAINTLLNSNKGGTLIELKRFLLENEYRKEYLNSVKDPSIHYYWQNEFVLLKKATISPLLTRLDTFLRPKTIRYILSQKQGLDFNEVLNKRKILLIKLSQGLIGEENSYLLGTLILSKIYQVAQARQTLTQKERTPFYIYLDEFQNFITPSLNSILSGARKYGVGLVLAHQELNQINDTYIGNSVLSNTNIRICFRLGDFDAKRLESGFSQFNQYDLQNLNIGEAIVRVGRNTDDFSLNSFPLEHVVANDKRDIITENSRKKYSKKISEVEVELNNLLSDFKELEKNPVEEKLESKIEILEAKNSFKSKGKEYLDAFKEKEEIREHRYLQTFVKKIAEQRGFKANIEEFVENGRVDVSLLKDSLKIACEIAVFNSVEYEIKNIKKCLKADYDFVCVISNESTHLEKIKEKLEKDIKKVHFFNPNQLIEFLDSLFEVEVKEEKRIKGYRIKVNYRAIEPI